MSDKLLNGLSMSLLPILFVVLFLVKNIMWSIPIFIVGGVIQFLLYQNHKKRNEGSLYLRGKIGPMLVGVALVAYLVIRHNFH